MPHCSALTRVRPLTAVSLRAIVSESVCLQQCTATWTALSAMLGHNLAAAQRSYTSHSQQTDCPVTTAPASIYLLTSAIRWETLTILAMFQGQPLPDCGS